MCNPYTTGKKISVSVNEQLRARSTTYLLVSTRSHSGDILVTAAMRLDGPSHGDSSGESQSIEHEEHFGRAQ